MTREKLTLAMSALADRKSKPTVVAQNLNIARTTLYDYLNGDGSLKEAGQRLLSNR